MSFIAKVQNLVLKFVWRYQNILFFAIIRLFT